MPDSGWQNLTSVFQTGSGATWNVAGTPRYADIAESATSKIIVFTGGTFSVPAGATEIQVEFEVQKSQQTGSNREVFDIAVFPVVDLETVGSDISIDANWSPTEYAPTIFTYSGDMGVVWTPSMFNTDFGIAIQAMAYANHPSVVSRANIYYAHARVLYTLGGTPVAREQLQYN